MNEDQQELHNKFNLLNDVYKASEEVIMNLNKLIDFYEHKDKYIAETGIALKMGCGDAFKRWLKLKKKMEK